MSAGAIMVRSAVTPAVYRTASELATPFVRRLLRRRLARAKEDGARVGERLGTPSLARPPGRLVWIHAASVGEAVSALPLIRALLARRAGEAALLTTGTVASAALLASRLPASACHQFAPVDCLSTVRRFLDHWRPDCGIWIESELWPNLILESAQRGIPLALVNARMSDRSYRRWLRLPGLVRPMLESFDICLAQSSAVANRLSALGTRSVEVTGNLKFDASPLPADEAVARGLASAIGHRPLWVAASTHTGEEAAVASAHRIVERDLPNLLTIVAPRHPERAAEIAQEIEAMGLRVARRSCGDGITAHTEIYLADTMGELGTFYRLSPIAFLGGSLAAHGGHNPIEPAQLDCAILFGPHMDNFAQVSSELRAAGAGHVVHDAQELAQAVRRLLLKPDLAAQRARAAKGVAASGSGVLETVLERLAPLMAAPKTEGGPEAYRASA